MIDFNLDNSHAHTAFGARCLGARRAILRVTGGTLI